MKHKVFCLFPKKEYEVDKFQEVLNLKNKNHELMWTVLEEDIEVLSMKKGEIFIVKSKNPYYTYLINTEERVNKLNNEIEKLSTSLENELSYARKLLRNYFVSNDIDKNTNFYQNNETVVICKYMPTKRIYRVLCKTTFEKIIKLRINEKGNIELVLLNLLFQLPVHPLKYIIIEKGT